MRYAEIPDRRDENGWIHINSPSDLPDVEQFDWVLVKTNIEGSLPYIAELRNGTWFANNVLGSLEEELDCMVIAWQPLPDDMSLKEKMLESGCVESDKIIARIDQIKSMDSVNFSNFLLRIPTLFDNLSQIFHKDVKDLDLIDVLSWVNAPFGQSDRYKFNEN